MLLAGGATWGEGWDRGRCDRAGWFWLVVESCWDERWVEGRDRRRRVLKEGVGTRLSSSADESESELDRRWFVEEGGFLDMHYVSSAT